LLKGVNKRVIIIKNPESEIFEEAYFILKSSTIKGIFKQSKDNEMVIEANRIISDYHNQQRSVIEKNGIASSIGGDMPDLDNFLNANNNANNNDNTNNINNINNINTADKKTNHINNTGKPDKNKNHKFNKIKKEIGINHSMAHLSDDEIFEDEKFFDNIHSNTEKNDYLFKNSDYTGYGNDEKLYKPAFHLISCKRLKFGHIPIPPKSFFIGIGFMSLVVILIRLIEYIILR